MHTNRLNENYKRESYNTKENALFHLLQTRFDSVYEENTTAYSTFGSLIADGEASHQENVRRLTLYQALLEKKNPTRKDFLEVDPKNGQAMWDNYSKLSKEKNSKVSKKQVKAVIPAYSEGGTLEKLAEANDTTIKELLRLNPDIKSNDDLKKGFEIVVGME